jgi:hypothetical protein
VTSSALRAIATRSKRQREQDRAEEKADADIDPGGGRGERAVEWAIAKSTSV